MPVFFGEVIRNARKAQGLTQRQLADSLGVSNTCVSNWGKGLSRPDADMIQKLCAALHLQANDLYGTREVPVQTGRQSVSDEDIKFALFGGDGEISDAMFDEVKRFAAFLKQREAGK